MKSRKDFQRQILTVVFVLVAALLIYFFWSGAWLPRIETPGEQVEFPKDEETSRILTPLQGLTDAVKSLGELVPDAPEKNETLERIKDFGKKFWEKIYEKLP